MRHHAGVVEDHVDAAVLLDGGVDQRLDLRRIGYVGGTCGRLAAASRNLLDEHLQPLDAPRPQHHRCPALGEISRGRFAQTAAGAGDDDDLARDVRIRVRGHFAAPLRLRTCCVNPFQNQIGDLQVVLVLHDHVAVAANATVGRREHFGLTASALDAADQGLTHLVTGLPCRQRREASRGVAVIAEDDQNRHLGQRLDLRRRCTSLDSSPARRARALSSPSDSAAPLAEETPRTASAPSPPRRSIGVASSESALIVDVDVVPPKHVGHTLLREFVHSRRPGTGCRRTAAPASRRSGSWARRPRR